MIKTFFCGIRLTILLALLFNLPFELLQAANSTWNSTISGNWSSGPWTASAPGSTSSNNSTDIATFGTQTGNGSIITVTVDNASQNIGSIAFGSSTTTANSSITISGNPLSLSSGGFIGFSNNANTAATVNQTVASALVLQPVSSSSNGNYTIFNNVNTASNMLIISGNMSGGSTSGSIALTLDGLNTGNNTLSGAISNGNASGGLSITKTGIGTWSISGNAANTFTGGLNVNRGTLNLDFSSMSTPTNLVDAANALSFGGGTFLVTGQNSSSTTSQTLASLAITGGANTLQLSPQGTGNTTVAFTSSNITRSGGGTLNFILPSNSTVSLNASLTNGIVGPWATVGTGNATTYAAVTSGTIYSYTGTTAAAPANMTATNGTVNYELTAATGTAPGSASLNTIRHAGTGGTLSLNATTGLTANGILNAGNGTLSIQTGNLIIGSNRQIVFNTANSSFITVSSNIANNNAGSSDLVKTGSSTLTLTGNNTYSGTTYVNQGTLQIGNSGTTGATGDLGNSTNLVVNSANLTYSRNNTYTYTGNITMSGPGTMTTSQGTGTYIFNPSAGSSIIVNTATSNARALVIGGNVILGGDGATYGNRTTSTNYFVNNPGTGGPSMTTNPYGGTTSSSSWQFGTGSTHTGNLTVNSGV